MNTCDRGRVRTVLVIVALAVAAGVTVFHVPLQGIFVLGVALVCPLLMFGMHAGGHGHDDASARLHGEHDGLRQLGRSDRKETDR